MAEYIDAVFNDGISHGFAVECRYNTCNGIIANARKYDPVTVEQSCAIAIDRNVFSSRKFEQILKTTEMLGKFNRSNTQANQRRKSPREKTVRITLKTT